MIIDKIENAYKYYSVCPYFEKVFTELKKIPSGSYNGRTDIDGDNAYINLSEYKNKPVNEISFEVHDIYADIQYIAEGKEIIDICDGSVLETDMSIPQGTDVKFTLTPSEYSTAYLTDGWFAIIFPGEAHRPGVAPDNIPCNVKKAVAKIKIK